MDDDGYPEESELTQISEWSWRDVAGLLAFVKERWTYPNFWTQADDLLRISTGGWSGNESLIVALKSNTGFWKLCWMSSHRGGHYEFDLSRGKF